MSCSLERPPMRMATRLTERGRPSSSVGVVSVVSVSVGNVSSGGGGGWSTSRPTLSVTVDRGSASMPPAGDWASTMPSSSKRSVSTNSTSTLKPAPRSVARAVPRSRPSTSGTCTCAGPSETVSTIVVPGRCSDPPAGSCAITVFSGCSEFWKTGEPAVKPGILDGGDGGYRDPRRPPMAPTPA